MMPFDAHSIAQVRCGDGIVMLDFQEDSYSCRYDPVEHDGQTAVDPPTPLWHEADRKDAALALTDVWHFARACCQALASFAHRPVRQLLIQASKIVAAPSPVNEADPCELAARFERMSLYLPVRPPCLLKAYMMLHFLSYYGQRADWVIGVQLFPFRAHCWLAIEDMLVGERAHLIEDYFPIYRLSNC